MAEGHAAAGRLTVRIITPERIVSSSRTYLPARPVNASATWNGCDRKR